MFWAVTAEAVASFDRIDDAGDDEGNDKVAAAVGAAGDESPPSCWWVPNTAATWPWGRLRMQVKVLRKLTSCLPRTTRQSTWMAAAGSVERLARLRSPCRQALTLRPACRLVRCAAPTWEARSERTATTLLDRPGTRWPCSGSAAPS